MKKEATSSLFSNIYVVVSLVYLLFVNDELSKYLRDILSPLVGNSDYIKNSYVWVEKALEFQFREDEELVSFDVVFTSISVELAVQIAAVRVENDQSLHERTSLSAKEVIELLNRVSVSRKLLQADSWINGSTGTVIVANLVMEELESNALSTFTQRPRLYYRFVDDTIAALTKTEIPKFHKHLNNQNVHIKYAPSNST